MEATKAIADATGMRAMRTAIGRWAEEEAAAAAAAAEAMEYEWGPVMDGSFEREMEATAAGDSAGSQMPALPRLASPRLPPLSSPCGQD